MNVYLIAILLLVSSITCAGTNSTSSCDVKNIRDFYNRVKSNGPLLHEANSKKEEFQTTIDIARQRPNPNMDIKYLQGNQSGSNIKNYSLSANHIFEFGDKRDKRIAKAKSFHKLKMTEIDLSLFHSNLHAAISYQRVAQLNITIESVKEAIFIFDKLITKLSSRKRLNPEETISFSTLILATNDYKAQLNDFENDKTLLLGKIQFLADCSSLNPIYKNLKYSKMNVSNSTLGKAGLLKLEDFKVDLAIGELEVQKSKAFSDISIGPTIVFQGKSETSDSYTSAGISVSFALPLFHSNDGGKFNALKKVSNQKLVSKNKKKRLTIHRENLVTKYNRSLNTLSKMPRLKELEDKHRKVEKLFSRGLVSISMTIESHRQQIEFLKSKFETENDVLDTFFEIHLIDGNTNSIESLL